jgi:hypothetical protein
MVLIVQLRIRSGGMGRGIGMRMRLSLSMMRGLLAIDNGAFLVIFLVVFFLSRVRNLLLFRRRLAP